MKCLKYIACLLLTAAACSCSEDKTDSRIKEQRQSLLDAQTVGIYQNGEAQLLFDKLTQQLFVDSSKATFRIQDDLGEKYLEIVLEKIPAAGERVSGTIRGDLGGQNADLKNIILLQNQNGQIRLWTDDGRWGMILPWPTF